MVSQDGKNLVFIFCLPRSGSTLLSLLLDGHERVCCPPEPWFLLKLLTMKQQVNPFCLYDDKLATFAINEFIDEPTFAASAAAFAATAYNARLQETGKTIFVDKTPRYYHVIDEIERTFPQAKKIFLKRNPLDVAWSYKTTWNLDPGMLTGGSVAPTLDFSLGLFKLQEYFKTPAPDRYVVEYESLVEMPGEILRNLCAFLEIDFQETMLDFSKSKDANHKKSVMGDKKIHATSTIHKSSRDAAIANFSKTDLQKIVSFIGKNIFVDLGYGQTVQALADVKVNFGDEHAVMVAREAYNKEKFSSINNCGNLSVKNIAHLIGLNKRARKFIFSAGKLINKL